MIRQFLTTAFVILALFGSASEQDGDSIGLQLMAATGDARRTLVRFLDHYAGLKAGAQQPLAGPDLAALCGWARRRALL